MDEEVAYKKYHHFLNKISYRAQYISFVRPFKAISKDVIPVQAKIRKLKNPPGSLRSLFQVYLILRYEWIHAMKGGEVYV